MFLPLAAVSKKQKNKRILKVYYKYVPLKPLLDRNNEKQVAEIRLSGDWLKDAGFDVNSIIEVEIEKNIMLITKIESTD